MEPDKRPSRTGRRVGREAILDAAADLLADVDLTATVGGVVGVRAVAGAAGVAPATVNHHFRPTGGARNERLVAAALDHSLHRPGASGALVVSDAVLEALADLRRGDPAAVRRIALAAAEDILWYGPDDAGHHDPRRAASQTAFHLALAAAACSPTARASLRTHYEGVTGLYRALYEEALDATGRRPRAGLTVDDLTTLLTAVSDGLVVRRRFDAAAAPVSLFGEVVVRLFEALTEPLHAVDDRDPTDGLVPLPPGSQLDVHKRAAMARAATDVYRTGGFDGLTVRAVERAAGVSRRTVITHFGDRNGLAAAVWSGFVPDLQRALDAQSDLALGPRVAAHLNRLADLVRSHHHLTAALLDGVFAYTVAHGPPRPEDPADPRALVPLPTIVRPVLLEEVSALRPGFADDVTQAADSAALLTNNLLHLAITRPNLAAGEVTARVCATTFAGMLRRRPAGW